MTTTPTLAQRIAFDIVNTVEQYPLIAAATSFADLHDVYDANESIIAAFEAHTGKPFHTNMLVNEGNEATDLIDRILRSGGFKLLQVFATARIVSLDIPATFGAELVIDDSDPAKPVVLMIQRFVVMPLESNAGFFGRSSVADDDVPGPVERAAIDYWEACNDGTWPIDKIAWEE